MQAHAVMNTEAVRELGAGHHRARRFASRCNLGATIQYSFLHARSCGIECAADDFGCLFVFVCQSLLDWGFPWCSVPCELPACSLHLCVRSSEFSSVPSVCYVRFVAAVKRTNERAACMRCQTVSSAYRKCYAKRFKYSLHKLFIFSSLGLISCMCLGRAVWKGCV